MADEQDQPKPSIAMALCDLIETLPVNLSTGRLYPPRGDRPAGECGYCALGWLLHMRGASNQSLRRNAVYRLTRRYLPELADKPLYQLTAANDHSLPENRREAAREAARHLAGCD